STSPDPPRLILSASPLTITHLGQAQLSRSQPRRLTHCPIQARSEEPYSTTCSISAMARPPPLFRRIRREPSSTHFPRQARSWSRSSRKKLLGLARLARSWKTGI